jgi:hypothetical protein
MSIVAFPYPVYQPAMRIIASVTNAFPATVTTTFAHQYLSGTIIRLIIPTGFGMVQANQLYGPINVTGPTTFTIDIDTTFFDAFAVPSSSPSNFPLNYQYAQTIPIGEINSILTAATQNVLPY